MESPQHQRQDATPANLFRDSTPNSKQDNLSLCHKISHRLRQQNQSKYTGKICGGVQVFVTDRDAFDPIRTAIAMLITAKALQPEGKLFWRTDNWIDKLTGSEWMRTAINAGKSADEVVDGWQQELAEFRATREKYLIYRKVRRNES